MLLADLSNWSPGDVAIVLTAVASFLLSLFSVAFWLARLTYKINSADSKIQEVNRRFEIEIIKIRKAMYRSRRSLARYLRRLGYDSDPIEPQDSDEEG